MITIRNNGNKIVHISKKALMPGEEMHTADIVGETPAIKVFAKHGILTITPYEEKVEETPAAEEKPAEEAKVAEAKVEEKTEEPPAPKKRGRKPATETEKEVEAE